MKGFHEMIWKVLAVQDYGWPLVLPIFEGKRQGGAIDCELGSWALLGLNLSFLTVSGKCLNLSETVFPSVKWGY